MITRDPHSRALRFIILMGIVSLFGDITYEGARSITAPYLATFGVSALVVGFISGAGEFFGYALRIFSGFLVDRTRRYWLITFVGYGLILSIPLLAFAGKWEIVAFLIILERIGKAVRSPARDSIISFASKKVGRGLGFAIHEAIDQLGAVLGPLILFFVLFKGWDFRGGFSLLFLPAMLCILFLFFARSESPRPEIFEEASNEKLSRTYWIYTLFVFLTMAGFVNFQIISFHFKIQGTLADAFIPAIYALAMGLDGLAALLIGKAYDRIGLKTLAFLPLLIIPIPILSFSRNLMLVVSGIVLWGVVMGMQETIMRAAIADLTSISKRGTGYGIFNTIFGLGWFFGGLMVGFLYDISPNYLALYVITLELLALLPLFLLTRNAS
jgi:MFS family permease